MRKILPLLLFTMVTVFCYSCSDEETPFLKVSPSTIHISHNGGNESITIKTNQDWVGTCPNWINVSPKSGKGDALVNITVEKNGITNREGYVIFQGVAGVQDMIEVIQNQKDIIHIDDSCYNVSWKAQTKGIMVKTNVDIQAKTDVSWIKLSTPVKDSNKNYLIQVSIDENVGKERKGEVIIEGKDVTTTVDVTQEEFVNLQEILFEEGKSITIKDDAPYRFKPIFIPSNASDKELKWSVSGEPKGLTISENGTLEIKASGEFVLKVENPRTKLQSSIDLHIYVPVRSIRITNDNSYGSIYAYPGFSTNLTYSFEPYYAYLADDNIFTSSNSSCVKVSEEGVIECTEVNGEANITITNIFSSASHSIRVVSQDYYFKGGRHNIDYSHKRDISFAGDIYSKNPYNILFLENIMFAKKVPGTNSYTLYQLKFNVVNQGTSNLRFFTDHLDFYKIYDRMIDGGQDLFNLIESECKFYVQIRCINKKSGKNKIFLDNHKIDMHCEY